MSNRTRLAAAAALTLVITAAGSGPAFADHGGSHHAHTLIDTEMLKGLTKAETKVANDRGIVGGGLPWVISEGEITVRADGRVKMEVEGLVIDPAAPVAVAGTNPITAFKVIVSCLDGDGKVTNVSTPTTPATATGDAELEATIALPSVCMSPKAFVTNPAGAWFAQT